MRTTASHNGIRMGLIALHLLLGLPVVAHAADPTPPPQGWSGSGEAGLAAASGNTRSENLNAKAALKYNDARWKNEFSATALRTKANVNTTVINTSTTSSTPVSASHYQLTAERVEVAASAGYKLDDHSYLVGAARYEHDDFSPYREQSIASIGYGYQVIKNARDEVAFEVGGGYKSVQAPTALAVSNPTHVNPDSLTGPAARGKFEYKHSFNSMASFNDTYLVESTSGNKFMQNDAGLQVKMTHQLGLKAAYEIRHNSGVMQGYKSTDQLLTTNLVYSF